MRFGQDSSGLISRCTPSLLRLPKNSISQAPLVSAFTCMSLNLESTFLHESRMTPGRCSGVRISTLKTTVQLFHPVCLSAVRLSLTSISEKRNGTNTGRPVKNAAFLWMHQSLRPWHKPCPDGTKSIVRLRKMLQNPC